MPHDLARGRRSVLIAAGPWPGADVDLRAEPGRWHGAAVDGHGRLERRDAVIQRDGRRATAASAAVQLPGPDGTITAKPAVAGKGVRPTMTVVAL